MKPSRKTIKRLEALAAKGPAVPAPDMQPVRSGLKLVLTPGQEPSPHAPQIISHRCSGDHQLAAVIERHWGLAGWLQSHDFPERRSYGRKSIYLVRNPLETLHESWRYWRTGGGAKNKRIAPIMDQVTFEQWLNGDAGRLVGYIAWRDGDADNLEINRGQFYDPLRYWLDHLMAAISVGLPIIRHDQLRRWSGPLTDQLVAALQRSPVQEVRDGVDMTNALPAGAMPPEPGVFDLWPATAWHRLNVMLNDAELLTACGLASADIWMKKP